MYMNIVECTMCILCLFRARVRVYFHSLITFHGVLCPVLSAQCVVGALELAHCENDIDNIYRRLTMQLMKTMAKLAYSQVFEYILTHTYIHMYT